MKKGYSLFNLNGFIRSVRWQEVAFYRFCKNSKIIDTKSGNHANCKNGLFAPLNQWAEGFNSSNKTTENSK